MSVGRDPVLIVCPPACLPLGLAELEAVTMATE